ncbi:calmin [Chanos chanos]|uniref:Calmin n=1 Tax=Chanos chanos TaxID=29144 RepID=A0A6J2VLL9_CHACN|nr:calmin [Chanos chanos]
MAGHEWDDWFEREEFIGQISDIRVQNLQVERELVQKRTFTRWMNLHLEKCNPPMVVHDLFRDIQDGKILMALLEELSGCKLLHGFKPSSHRIFRLNNIAKVLAFLEERNVKLVSIDAVDVADGNSSIILGLIWNIILFFQIKELTGNIKSQFPSSSSLSSIPTSSDSDTSHSSTPSDERRPSIAARDHGKAIKTLLQWVQRRTRKYGVAVQDFGKSWTSGLAFLAVIKSIDPSLVDMRRALLRSPRENIEEAFRTAHYSLGIPRLLEPEDVTLNPPDEQSIMTYVSQFLEHFPGMEEDQMSDVIERSKVSARLNEPMVRNGVQRKREKSCVVKRDWVQPPPKIFISSVSDDLEQTSSPVHSGTSEDRPWASEESSVGFSPSPADDRSFNHSLDLNKEVYCTVSSSSSPQPSFADSVIESPDSWSEMTSETTPLEELQQSPSDVSLGESSETGELRDSSSTCEMLQDQESPLALDGNSHENTDTELFIDEGNFSLSSVESLQAKTTLPSEDEDAYRYILELNEDGTASDMPKQEAMIRSNTDSDLSKTQLVQCDKTVFQSPHELAHGDSDSGFFPGDKDYTEHTAVQSDAGNTEAPTGDSERQETDVKNKMESESEYSTGVTESSSHVKNTTAVHRLSPESLDEPDQVTVAVKAESEPECLNEDEKIPSKTKDGKEPLCSELSEKTQQLEEPEDHNVQDVLSDCMGTKKDCSINDDELIVRTGLIECKEEDQTKHLEDEPQEDPEQSHKQMRDIAEQVCTEPEVPPGCTHYNESKAPNSPLSQREEVNLAVGLEGSDISGGVEMKDFAEAKPQASAGLSQRYTDDTSEITPVSSEGSYEDSSLVNEVTEKGLCNGEPDPDRMTNLEGPNWIENELEEKFAEEGTRNNSEDEPSAAKSSFEKESRGAEGISEDVTNVEESKLENEERPAECEMNDEVPCKISNTEGEEDKTNRAISVIPLDMVYYPHYDVPISEVIEAFVEPKPDSVLCEEDNLSPTSPVPHSPVDSTEQNIDSLSLDCQDESQAISEEAEEIPTLLEEPEKDLTDHRLSLSVTPLQPAPTQHRSPDSETDSEDGMAQGSDDVIQRKSGEVSPKLQDQCLFEPWERHPGEWGAVEIDVPAEQYELIKTDEELAAARENMETLREISVGDNSTDESQLCERKVIDSNELQGENGSPIEASSLESIGANKREESKTSKNQENSDETEVPELHILLIVWLILYCLFVLPQMDFWSLPHLLLNLNE